MTERKIRVIVANRPRLLRELVLTTISEQPDIEIVGVANTEEEILGSVDQTHPDFLIIALEDSGNRPVICDFVLERHPEVKILAIAPKRNVSVFYWASIDICCECVESSERGILETLRKRQPAMEAQQ